MKNVTFTWNARQTTLLLALKAVVVSLATSEQEVLAPAAVEIEVPRFLRHAARSNITRKLTAGRNERVCINQRSRDHSVTSPYGEPSA